MRYFTGSFAFTAVCLGLGYWLGGLTGVWIVAVLGVLETSLSFDNAVVNAATLENMDSAWRRRFLTWGMIIAVFGMRVVFPLAIVAIAASINPLDALMLAIKEPDEYASVLIGAHVHIAAFGGAFLGLVFLKFFLDQEKDSHWLAWLEVPMSKLGGLEIALVLAGVVGVGLACHAPLDFIVSGIAGIATHVAVDYVGDLLGEEDHTGKVIRTGLAGFLYLEVLDASFSFDGVIGAFALSNNLFIIALGLGIGAMFVRSLTIMMVEKKTLDAFKYLEHGAFWAIGALAGIMFASVFVAIPETVTGLVGAGLIGAALVSSVVHNRHAVA